MDAPVQPSCAIIGLPVQGTTAGFPGRDCQLASRLLSPSLAAREFFYDGAQQRYLVREVDPDTWEPVAPGAWTDYFGQMPYGDFEFAGAPSETPAEQVRYFAAAGLHAQEGADGANARYLHGTSGFRPGAGSGRAYRLTLYGPDGGRARGVSALAGGPETGG